MGFTTFTLRLSDVNVIVKLILCIREPIELINLSQCMLYLFVCVCFGDGIGQGFGA